MGEKMPISELMEPIRVKCVGMRFYPESHLLTTGSLRVRLHNSNKDDPKAVAVIANGNKLCSYLVRADALRVRAIMRKLKYVHLIRVEYVRRDTRRCVVLQLSDARAPQQ